MPGSTGIASRCCRNWERRKAKSAAWWCGQLGFWFGLPVGTAVLTGAAAVGCLLVMVQAEIQAYIGFGAFAVQVGMTALILLLECYFVST